MKYASSIVQGTAAVCFVGCGWSAPLTLVTRQPCEHAVALSVAKANAVRLGGCWFVGGQAET